MTPKKHERLKKNNDLSLNETAPRELEDLIKNDLGKFDLMTIHRVLTVFDIISKCNHYHWPEFRYLLK